jgi:hypothetical protein
MLRIILSAVILAMVSTAAEARVRWQGVLHIVAQSGCTDYNPVGDYFRVRFRPANVSDNGPNTFLSMFGGRNSQSFKVAGSIGTTLVTAETMTTGDGFGPYDVAAQIRFTAVRDFTLLPVFAVLAGQIKNYDYMPGCLVTFRLGLIKRAD